MPRNKVAWIEKAWQTLELAASIGIFFLGIWITSLLPNLGAGKWFVSAVLSLAAGVFLPNLLFAKPSLKLKWNIDGVPIDSGRPTVDLRTPRPGMVDPEIAFRVDLVSETTSLLGYLLLRSIVSKRLSIFVEATPPGVVEIKRQSSSPNAQVTVPSPQSIRLGVGAAEHGRMQSRFVGSFLPILLGGGIDDLDLSARLYDSAMTRRSRRATISSGIVGIRVRS